jgi:L-serine dehydratase
VESISVFDIFKVGVGPSSSHTMGPWKAAGRFLASIGDEGSLGAIERVQVDLFGSLAKTGKGHGTDIAVIMGLAGTEPETVDPAAIYPTVDKIRASRLLPLAGGRAIPWDEPADLVFHFDEALPAHPNGLRFTAEFSDGRPPLVETYYSVGGGFVVCDGEIPGGANSRDLPYPIEHAADLLRHCDTTGWPIPRVVLQNERAWRDDQMIAAGLDRIWRTMLACAHRGSHSEGVLPGGLGVVRRAQGMSRKLLGGRSFADPIAWTEAIRDSAKGFTETLRWVSCFALAVNEENAAFGRVVTAPTNGAAGVVPAVLLYHHCFGDPSARSIEDFLLTAGEIGSIFKKGATLSAAQGGCQAEIGVSSAMAAAGLCQVSGGTVGQVMMAAEIAMEHHLGLTCDPVGGLVQIPCIERNTMGAMKAITACNIALDSDPARAKVSLDAVVRSMWATAQDMSTKYKETSEGGLAVLIPVNVPEC